MKTPPLDLVFAGTPEFAVRHLQALLAGRHRVMAVYTQPDRKAGRGKKLTASPVKELALRHGLVVKQPTTLKNQDVQDELADFKADLLIVVAYGLILPPAVLTIPHRGCINVHASLLPRWRGAAPIERAILSGDDKSGVTIMQMDAGLDTGDMLLCKSVPIEPRDTRLTLEDKIATVGIEALQQVLDDIDAMQRNARPQNDSDSTYAGKLEKQDALIQWRQSAEFVDRQIRAGIGRNPAYCHFDSQRMRVLTASVLSDMKGNPGEVLSCDKEGLVIGCGRGSLCITQVQLAGKKPVSISDLLNARPDQFRPGMTLQPANT